MHDKELLVVEQFYKQHELLSSDKHFVIAFSGGLDSTALLHIMHRLANKYQLNLKAVHVNHGLSPNSDAWEKHCLNFCANLNIAYQAHQLKLELSKGQSLEALAREQRYAALYSSMQAEDVLLTAHHKDDVAETFLLQMLRGSGVRGLAAIAPIRTLGPHNQVNKIKQVIARPLLELEKAQLQSYVSRNKLVYVEDESNAKTNFLRNYIRHNLMPSLVTRIPGAVNCIARSAQLCQSELKLLEEVAKQDYLVLAKLYKKGVLYSKKDDGNLAAALNIQQLLKLSKSRTINVLRYWLQAQQVLALNSARVSELYRQLNAVEGCHIEIATKEYSLRSYQGYLYLIKQEDSKLGKNLQLSIQLDSFTTERIIEIAEQKFKLRKVKGQGIDITGYSKISFQVNNSMQTKLYKPNSKTSTTLQKLCQEYNIPPWERANLLTISLDNSVIRLNGVLEQAGKQKVGVLQDKLENTDKLGLIVQAI